MLLRQVRAQGKPHGKPPPVLHRSRRPVPLLLLLLLYSSTRRATDDLSRTPKHTRATQQSITNRMPQDNHHGQSHGRTGV